MAILLSSVLLKLKKVIENQSIDRKEREQKEQNKEEEDKNDPDYEELIRIVRENNSIINKSLSNSKMAAYILVAQYIKDTASLIDYCIKNEHYEDVDNIKKSVTNMVDEFNRINPEMKIKIVINKDNGIGNIDFEDD